MLNKIKFIVGLLILCVFGLEVGKAFADESIKIYINDKNVVEYVEEGLDAATNGIGIAVGEGVNFIEEKALAIINS